MHREVCCAVSPPPRLMGSMYSTVVYNRGRAIAWQCASGRWLSVESFLILLKSYCCTYQALTSFFRFFFRVPCAAIVFSNILTQQNESSAA